MGSRMGKLVEVALVVAATLAVSEVILRLINPRPRVQISRPVLLDVPGGVFEMAGGQPIWRHLGTEARWNEGCVRPGTLNVLLVGTSITFGSGLGPADPFSVKAQALLDQQEPGRWCLLNVAQPAYTGAQKEAELALAIERWHPEVVLWELWGSDADHYTMIAGDAYNFGATELNAHGLPSLLPLPEPVETWLFVHSQLYQYAATALGTGTRPDEERWADWAAGTLPRIGETVSSSGARLGFFVPTRLDRPMAEMAADSTRVERAATPWLTEHGAPVLRFAEALQDSDPADIALDPDGHLNAEGHTRLAEPFVRWLTTEVMPETARAERASQAVLGH